MQTTALETKLVSVVTCLNDVSASLNQVWGSAFDVTATLRRIIEGAGQVAPGAQAALYTYDPAQRTLAPTVAGVACAADHLMPLALQAAEQMRLVLSYDESATMQAIACLPLMGGKEAAGVLCVCADGDHRFSPLELLLLNAFANQAALVISHSVQIGAVQRDLARKQEELHRLRRAGMLISSRTRLDDTLVAILQMALEVTEAKYGIFRLVDETGKNLLMRAIAGEHLGRPAVEALPINSTSIMGLVAKSRQPFCITDVRENPWARIYYPLDHSLEMRSELAVPLIGASGRLEGVLNLESPAIGAFDEDDSHLLQALATQAVIAIQEVRLLDALQDMAERLLTQPLPEVLNHLVTVACQLLNVGASAIWTLHGERLILAAARGGHVRGHNLPLQGSLTGQAILSRGPVVSDDVRSDPRFNWPDLARAQGWQRALIMPLLVTDGEPVGAISVYGTEAEPGQSGAPDWDKKVLTILAHYAALAVRHTADQTALRIAQEQRVAAETFAAVGDITANLVHHLNNKIGAIPVRVEGIQDKSSAVVAADPYLAANLEEIGRSAREAMAAVRQSLSHLQTPQLGPVSVAACAAEALNRVHVPPTVHVQLVDLAGLPSVLAGYQGLTLVFTNLLENASDAMGGNGTIEIRGSAGATEVQVAVRDSGPGVAPDLHERIFELSFSGRRSGKLGFGLWWVKTWMTRLGGSVSIESDGAQGACFTLHLPRAEEGA